MPNSIKSEPQESRTFNAFDVVTKSGSPAVMKGISATWSMKRGIEYGGQLKRIRTTINHFSLMNPFLT